MIFPTSPRASELKARLLQFFATHITPNDAALAQELAANRARGEPFKALQSLQPLQEEARRAGLWNLFLPSHGGLSNLDYAVLCEVMGRVPWSAEVFNCSAPDTGNMETLELYGSAAQKRDWLEPLLQGRIRSAFLMTEPAVASSDATNIQCSIRRDGDEYVIDGHKWWSTGAGHPHCRLLVVMGRTDPQAATHQQQSMILVPADAPGVTVVRPLTVFGYDDAPSGHAEVRLDAVRVPAANLLLGEGRGFEIAQGRLGPGRVHHCMRSIGVAEVALEMMCRRLDSRVAFGQRLSSQSLWHERIAHSRCLIDQARLLVLHAAHRMDVAGNKAARNEIAMIKAVVPRSTLQVLDWAIQAHGAAGLDQDCILARLWAGQRTLRLADGPDEVHDRSIAKAELARHRAAAGSATITTVLARSA